MIKKIILMALCLSLPVMCLSDIAYGFEAIYKCREQLLQKYPSVEAIKKQFGDRAKWQEKTMPSPHGGDLELQIRNMVYPGIMINTLGYTIEGEDSFFIILLSVEKAGFVKFLGVDIGSDRADVIKNFGNPQGIERVELTYHDEAEFYLITFTIENNKVVGMKFETYMD
jgi:hypothetical protein